VNFFRAFDPTHVAVRAIQIQGFRDLDAHPDLVVGSGHVEHGGMVMVSSQPEQAGAAPTRQPADRAGHGDDERSCSGMLRARDHRWRGGPSLLPSGCTPSRPPP